MTAFPLPLPAAGPRPPAITVLTRQLQRACRARRKGLHPTALGPQGGVLSQQRFPPQPLPTRLSVSPDRPPPQAQLGWSCQCLGACRPAASSSHSQSRSRRHQLAQPFQDRPCPKLCQPQAAPAAAWPSRTAWGHLPTAPAQPEGQGGRVACWSGQLITARHPHDRQYRRHIPHIAPSILGIHTSMHALSASSSNRHRFAPSLGTAARRFVT